MSHSLTIFDGTATWTVPASRLAISVLRNHVRKDASEVPSSICTSAFCHSSRLLIEIEKSVVMRIKPVYYTRRTFQGKRARFEGRVHKVWIVWGEVFSTRTSTPEHELLGSSTTYHHYGMLFWF